MLTDWSCHIVPIIRRVGKRYAALEGEITKLTPEAQEQLFHLLQKVEEDARSSMKSQARRQGVMLR